MARLMRYMINYGDRKLFSTLHIKLAKPIIYDLAPPILEIIPHDGEPWHCGLSIVNASVFSSEDTIFHYTIDGTEPTKDSPVFTDGIEIDRNCTVRIIAMYESTKVMHMSASIGKLVIDNLRNGMAKFKIGG